MGLVVQPDRHNWRQFCQEEELTEAETAKWNEMASAIREAEARGDGELFDFITAEVQVEEEELRRIQTHDWSDLVASVDAGRRLKRAELRAWRNYHQEVMDGRKEVAGRD